MAIFINGTTTIFDDRRGKFNLTNFSNYTQDQLYDLEIKGDQVGDIVYNTTTSDLNFWDGQKWVPQPNKRGEAIFTNEGTYTWTCPEGVESVCVVCVGGGGAGGQDRGKLGGFGGGLGWKNNIPVKVGQAYKVVVGKGGIPKSSLTNGNGGDSYFISTNTVMGAGGRAGDTRQGELYETTFLPGGRYLGDGGGVGGGFNTYWAFAHGGAGAGGYTGNGGSFNYNIAGDSGQGGGGGAGTNGDGGVPIGYAVCISVIDECSPSHAIISSDWDSFRSAYPDREFWLLQPTGEPVSALKIPSSYNNDPKANAPQTVNRDNGVTSRASDWFTMCNLSQVLPGTSISLAIDNSGSTKIEHVKASLDLFRQKCRSASLTIYEANLGKTERWAVPHNRPLPEISIGGSGETQGNGGGGVGIYGQGADGLGGGQGRGRYGEGGSSTYGTGTNGKRGNSGGRPDGGFPGGGGGADHKGIAPGRGGGGAVRILWGRDRKFPSTDVDLTVV